MKPNQTLEPPAHSLAQRRTPPSSNDKPNPVPHSVPDPIPAPGESKCSMSRLEPLISRIFPDNHANRFHSKSAPESRLSRRKSLICDFLSVPVTYPKNIPASPVTVEPLDIPWPSASWPFHHSPAHPLCPSMSRLKPLISRIFPDNHASHFHPKPVHESRLSRHKSLNCDFLSIPVTYPKNIPASSATGVSLDIPWPSASWSFHQGRADSRQSGSGTGPSLSKRVLERREKVLGGTP